MINTTQVILGRLKAPFNESQISWKAGRKENDQAQALPYIDNRFVQNLLDEVVGPENWVNSYHEVIGGNRLIAVRCKISIRLDGEWISKEDGAPLGDGDLAVKGVYSDAMKRAAVQWGIGRYLYEFVPPWIPLDTDGQLTRIPTLSEGMGSLEDRNAAKVANIAANATAKATALSASAAAGAPATAGAQDNPVKQDVKGESAKVVETQASEAYKQVADPVVQSSSAENVSTQVRAEPKAETASTETAVQSKAANESDIASPSATFVEMKEKIAKMPLQMLRNYINGPKGKEKLVELERKVLLALIDERENAQSTATA